MKCLILMKHMFNETALQDLPWRRKQKLQFIRRQRLNVKLGASISADFSIPVFY